MLRLSLVVLAFFVTSGVTAWAQAPGGWLADPKTNCKFWWPNEAPDSNWTYTYSSAHWAGACRNGTASGRGTFDFTVAWHLGDGEAKTFVQSGEGDFVNGKLTGKGFTTFRQYIAVIRHEGEFRDGLMTGRGVETREGDKLFERYDGEFRDGKKNGWGVETNEAWSGQGQTRDRAYFWRYEGEYRDGDWNGRGVYVSSKKGCSAQMKYEGEYKNGRWDGRGTLTTLDGKTHSGIFSEGSLGRLSTIEAVPLAADFDKVCR
jgi:hypothetical protein